MTDPNEPEIITFMYGALSDLIRIGEVIDTVDVEERELVRAQLTIAHAAVEEMFDLLEYLLTFPSQPVTKDA